MIEEKKHIETKKKDKKDAPIIQITDLHKTFGKNNQILKGVNLTVNKEENLVILGRSGSGKSVTIKCIVGLIVPDKGEIKVFDEDVLNLNKSELNEVRIRIGFLFQSGALYDSMSVRENLAFTLRKHNRDLTSDEIENQVLEALENVGLADAIDKMPSELSGGMQKRIGLARTLILKPEIILYDEPTTGLDTITSREISELILDIKNKWKTTSIIITHDMACAKLTADRIMVLKDGVIHAEGTYEELEKSDDEWVRSFFE
ncbi:ABC transporter ATP-binding protein [Flavobacterium sp. HTF]|uniref:ABC transporter ATP-binding protein n=1 Tax=Flavobacterium sp. HTF TaxID=2170732 RepID=UPI000D5E6172|nr:ABC transporter ATP-binding protein [Flavobacterium sp. HTF]PWB23773.1 ABC transporter ATP-binding protein [Flavobacterium sp. HTF]